MRVAVVNLGCKVNRYECDAMLALLERDGVEALSGMIPADAYIINTCAVTVEAERKSRQTVARCLKKNPAASVYVVGCAAQNNKNQFLSMQGVKHVCGTRFKSGVVAMAINDLGGSAEGLPIHAATEYEELGVVPKTERRRAYVKIQDGCDSFSGYCLIPFLRGASRSRETAVIFKECAEVSKRSKDIVLTGINISDYKPGLAELITALQQVKARFWLGSLEVFGITPELMYALKGLYAFGEHFHLSLQSGDDGVLKDMNRRYTRLEYLAAVELIREHFPNAKITTDVIVGYPTEDERAFLNTLSLIKCVRFDAAHIFPYSRRPGTVAAELKEVDSVVVAERVRLLKKEYVKE